MSKFYECFPVKIRKFSSDDRPWVTERVNQLYRLQNREFYKNHKSEKWKRLNAEFEQKCETEKKKYCENIISDLKTSNPSKWYSKLKRMSGQDQNQLNQNTIRNFFKDNVREEGRQRL